MTAVTSWVTQAQSFSFWGRSRSSTAARLRHEAHNERQRGGDCAECQDSGPSEANEDLAGDGRANAHAEKHRADLTEMSTAGRLPINQPSLVLVPAPREFYDHNDMCGLPGENRWILPFAS